MSESPRVTLNPALGAAHLRVMNFLNEVASEYPDAISFAPGRPTELFFEVDRAQEQIGRYVAFRARQAGLSEAAIRASIGQYGATKGIIGDLIARHLLVDEKIDVPPEAVMVTVGAQEAMSILLQGLFDRERDVLLVTDPNYIGMTGAAHILGLKVESVPVREDGIDLQALEAVHTRVRKVGLRPKALYDIPDFHNPLGTSMPLANRRRLLELARELDFLILEDNPYGMFAYDGERLPTLKSLDRDRSVIYLGTFAKTLFPGLRLGYLAADQEVPASEGRPPTLLSDELSKVKSLTTVNTSPLLQAIVGGFLLESGGGLAAGMADKIRFYRQNRDRMLTALERAFSASTDLAGAVTWNRPGGGFFMVVHLPFEWTERDVRACAREYAVVVCPMSFFSLGSGYERAIRLSFSYVTPEQIDEGVDRLQRFVRSVVRGGRPPS